MGAKGFVLFSYNDSIDEWVLIGNFFYVKFVLDRYKKGLVLIFAVHISSFRLGVVAEARSKGRQKLLEGIIE